jgi:leader peptidase (prepilin peptidase) / N-methyltransferase
LRFGLTIDGIGMVVLSFLLLGLAVMDAETMKLPDALTWPGIVLGVVASGVTGGVWEDRLGGGYLPFGSAGTGSETWFPLPFGLEAAIPAMIASALWALTAALLLLLIRWLYFLVRHRQGLGMGDVKLLAMIAAWLGPMPTLLTLLLGCVAAAIFGVLSVALARGSLRSTRLPLGSFLCAAAIYVIFAGDAIIRWYLRFYGLS